MRTCVAIRHVGFEDLDGLAPVLAGRGFTHRYVEAPLGLDGLDVLSPDLVVVLGGPIGANDDRDFPFLAHEVELIRRRLDADRPILGICLGAQLMARALGARVYPNPAGKEIGWSSLALTPEGEASVLLDLAGAPVLHWHGDTFDLPHGALPLAETPATPNQAFSWGMRALALQFHLEVTRAGLERWYVGHVGELSAQGLSVPELRADGLTHGALIESRGQSAFGRWIDEVCS
ncbi:MAG TPA: glutamine amidotransferase [Candidatus Omnitrophota bacterium]|nr:glutamine amidotransferase [Candidatus Omnitrophota bacterium]